MRYEAVLRDLALADDRFVVMTAENRAPIRNLPAILGERFVDVGIAEQTLIGAAAGLALRGRIPVCHALATFLTMRPFEFIRTDVGIPRLPVKLVGWVPGLLSEANGPTHQALEDVALMRGIPGMNVFCPGDEDDLVLGLPEVLASPAPTYVRYCGRPAAVVHRPFRLGEAEVLRDGRDVAILTYGTLLTEAVGAADLLSEAGLSTRLVNLRTLAPLDEEIVLAAVAETRLTVTLEDHFGTGGLRTILAELLLARRVMGRVLSVGLESRWFRPALLPDVLATEDLTPAALADRVRSALKEET